MQKMTWGYQCCICQRPIQRGKPTILFATDDLPMMVGICHSTCGSRRYSYGHFQMCPPDYLSDQQVSFLVQFFHKLYSLPGGTKPNRELRLSLITFLQDYPSSLVNPMASLRKFLDEYKHRSYQQKYGGDLETDFLRILGQIQRETGKKPVGVDIDFRT